MQKTSKRSPQGPFLVVQNALRLCIMSHQDANEEFFFQESSGRSFQSDLSPIVKSVSLIGYSSCKPSTIKLALSAISGVKL